MSLRSAACLVGIGALAALCAVGAQAAAPVCEDVDATLSQTYEYVIGSAGYSDADGAVESGSRYRWLLNGVKLGEEQAPDLLLISADGGAEGAGGDAPLEATGVTYHPGKWGSALTVGQGGILRYPRSDNFDTSEGTLEMWIAPLADGNNAIYAESNHVLFEYRGANGDYIQIAQSGEQGIIYAGSNVRGQWQSAWGAGASMRDWRAAEWHHIAYTWSASGSFMRFYVDGALVADSNEGHYWPPAMTGPAITLGSSVSGDERAHYLLDAVRISSRPLVSDVIAAEARRLSAPRPNEVWLATKGLRPGDEVVFEYTPSDGTETGAPCSSRTTFPGIPLADPRPVSTLLPPGTTELDFSITTIEPTTCRYAVGAPLSYDEMMPFDSGDGTTEHQVRLVGLNPDTTTVNRVYIRCQTQPDYVLGLRYRCLPEANPSFPRTSNLWGMSGLLPKGLEYCARIDLWLGAWFTPRQIAELRRLNPDILILTSINAVENGGLPEDYYFHDIHGKKVEVWPGSYRLNLTKPYVAEHQARFAYQKMLEADLMVDGCFFDNVMTTQSWQSRDIYGKPFLYDADENGEVDDPAVLDAAWKAGVFHEMKVWRDLMPHAITTGHAYSLREPGIPEIFNGLSYGFVTADVLEGETPFSWLWQDYHDWFRLGRPPVIMNFESSPVDQIAYGYDYAPWDKIPASTLEFARTYYPEMRFGLCLTLVNDGYFAHEFGDTWHGNDWWYDELDFDLGQPLGPAYLVPQEGLDPRNWIDNGGFEDPSNMQWSIWANDAAGAAATVERDTINAVEGAASAHITVTDAGEGQDWQIDFAQHGRHLVEGKQYRLSFWAKSGVPRSITLSAQKGSPNWDSFGLRAYVQLTTEWQEYSVTFEASETTEESRIQFFVGAVIGEVWLDDVRLVEAPPAVYRRDFQNGSVLLNGTGDRREIDVGKGYARLKGDQAPRYQYILDDADESFTVSGSWSVESYDTGEWTAGGPFYHAWKGTCHESDRRGGEGRWTLEVREDDRYTVEAWWPAAPEASSWSDRVVYEVVADGKVVASATLNQQRGGDEWHPIAEVALSAGDGAFVRVRNEGSGACVADAVCVRSASRYNDGSPTETVTLQPLDGIVLRRVGP